MGSDFILVFFGLFLIGGIWIVASGERLGWILIGLVVLAVLVRMFERVRHNIRQARETKPCPTCNGRGRIQ